MWPEYIQVYLLILVLFNGAVSAADVNKVKNTGIFH